MAKHPFLTPSFGPTAIAIHDDRHMLRHAMGIDPSRTKGALTGLVGV
jgi:hypothetical protein